MMIELSKKRIRKYVKYLREKLLEAGTPKEQINSLSDHEILEDFRKCCDCGDDLFTPDQQMHTILEFDSPERVFEVLYEELEPENCLVDENDEDEVSEDEKDEDEEDEDIVNISFREILDESETIADVVNSSIIFIKKLVALREQGYEIKQIKEDYLKIWKKCTNQDI